MNTENSLLHDLLQKIPRRYQVNGGLTPLVAAIEAAQEAVERGKVPETEVKHRFLEALAQLIRNAMSADQGDPAFQALVLEHQAATVREYVSLSARAAQDRHSVMAAVNAVAHPAKLKRCPSEPLTAALSELYEAASSSSWAKLQATAQRIIETPAIWCETASKSNGGKERRNEAALPTDASALSNVATLKAAIARIRDDAALTHLQRLEALEIDPFVQQYVALRAQNGPRPGSTDATEQGSASKKRGARVEALAAQALQELADRLNQIGESTNTYRIATSLHVPAALIGSAQRSKAEWDVVLLRQAASNKAAGQTLVTEPSDSNSSASVWHVCLLVEAKASADAATTDFPRLLRGLQLLARADSDTVYSFKSRQETIYISGASLTKLKTDEAELKNTVLYCTDAPVDASPRLLNPASRMQLLSAPASLEFAGQLATASADLHSLEPVWHALVESPRWRAVLNQYQTLRQVRGLMVHVDDLRAIGKTK